MLSSSTKVEYLYVTVVILFAAVIRVYNIGSVPVILNPDEAALAYNAILLKETGTDEWQQVWPIILKSFGDTKLVGYPLLLVLLFSYIEPSDAVVRLPSVIAGVVLVWLSWKWATWLIPHSKLNLIVPLFSAISPVFVFYSRMAFEANVALVFLIASVSLVFVRQQPSFHTDLVALVLYILAIFTYNTPLLLAPFIAIGIIWWRGWRRPKKWVFIVVTMLIVSVAGMQILHDVSKQKSTITIFSDATYREQAATYFQRVPSFLSPLAKPITFFVLTIIQKFVQSLGLHFLVDNGGTHPWHSLPHWGHVLLPEYVLAVFGITSSILTTIYTFFRRSRSLIMTALSKQAHGKAILTLFFTVVGLAPAVITVDAPHATRSLFFFFGLVLLSGYGLRMLAHTVTSLTNIGKWLNLNDVLFLFTCSVTIMFGMMYLYDYFLWYPFNHPVQLPIGFKTVVREIQQQHPQKRVAVVDPDGTLYILASWYMKLHPSVFFNTIHKQNPTPIGFQYGDTVANIHFITQLADWKEEDLVYFRVPNQSEWYIQAKY